MHYYTAHGDCVDIAVAALLILPLIKLYALNILHFTLSLKMKCVIVLVYLVGWLTECDTN